MISDNLNLSVSRVYPFYNLIDVCLLSLFSKVINSFLKHTESAF